MIIAIDGPAGAGKSSVALEVAKRLNLQYVDTGAIYRTLAWSANRLSVASDDVSGLVDVVSRLEISFKVEDGINRVTAVLDGRSHDVTGDIRSAEISQQTSKVSAHPEVRTALLQFQRDLGQRVDALLEGRDIGTVVFPDAEVKIFLTATPEERADRRWKQLSAKAEDPTTVPSVETIAAEIRERDTRDSQRKVAPLVPAEDSHIVDTTNISFDEVISHIVGLAKRSM